MKAPLMQTINDFHVYRIVSNQSMHEKLACSYCMENNKAFTLTKCGKAFFFFYCHYRFLPTVHKYRKDFFVGIFERDVVLPVLSGEKLYDVVLQYEGIMFDFQFGKQKFHGFGVIHNWVKQSIFLELFYWKTNLFCSNMDVIHIKRNIFENIFNMVMNVKRKTKDNMKARMDIHFVLSL